MALYRVQAQWSGFQGAPGYSVFHFDAAVAGNEDGAAASAARVRSFFGGVINYLPMGVRITVDPTVTLIEESNGQIQEFFSIDPLDVLEGTGDNVFAASAGAVVTWDTAGVRNGRRVRGRTFLVPISAANGFSSDGTLNEGFRGALTSAANALHEGAIDLHVWSRPSGPGASDGVSYSVRSARVPDKAAVLRSRRD